MHLRLETTLPAPADWVWQQVQTCALLRRVTWPLLTFSPAGTTPLPPSWTVGICCELKLHLFGLLPLGQHTIRIVGIHPHQHRLDTEERGSLARVWRHSIRVEPIDQHRCRYADELEIVGRAGLTWPVWCFAQLFYRYRQGRWRRWAACRSPAPTDHPARDLPAAG